MKRIFLLLVLLLPIISFAQKTTDFTDIDKIAREAPKKYSQSIEELTTYLTKDAQSDLEKVRAFYVWVTDNIKYDTKLAFGKPIDPHKRHEKEQYPSVLKTKRGVCEGYANLFQELCTTAGIPAEIVTGYSKNQKGRVSRIGHAWNAVQIDHQWFLVDNTWGAGYVDGDKKKFHPHFQEKYFLGDPNEFIQNHYPHDYIFQLLDTPVAFTEFKKKKIPESAFKKGSTSMLNPHDSITHYHSLPDEQKKINEALRILAFDPSSNYAKAKAAEYYNDQAWNLIKQYRRESKPIKENLNLLTASKINAWTDLIVKAKGFFYQAETYGKTMKPGDKAYRRLNIIKKNSKSGRNSLRNMEQQLKSFQRYLNHK